MRTRTAILGTCLAALAAAALADEADGRRRGLALRSQLNDTEVGMGWIYNDLPTALERARKQGKPVFVVFRCVP